MCFAFPGRTPPWPNVVGVLNLPSGAKKVVSTQVLLLVFFLSWFVRTFLHDAGRPKFSHQINENRDQVGPLIGI